MVRFLLLRTSPHVELYASPVNFDPVSPMFPISYPRDYAAELSTELGPYYTTGMVEDHSGLTNERFDEHAFLAQCDDALRERNGMMQFELARMTEGFLFCLFDTPDRLQHMFWRFRESDHPANAGRVSRRNEFAGIIEDHYARCDAIVGEALATVDDRTLCIVLSDHGFGSFQRRRNRLQRDRTPDDRPGRSRSRVGGGARRQDAARTVLRRLRRGIAGCRGGVQCRLSRIVDDGTGRRSRADVRG